jgi:hypothetical protein
LSNDNGVNGSQLFGNETAEAADIAGIYTARICQNIPGLNRSRPITGLTSSCTAYSEAQNNWTMSTGWNEREFRDFANNITQSNRTASKYLGNSVHVEYGRNGEEKAGLLELRVVHHKFQDKCLVTMSKKAGRRDWQHRFGSWPCYSSVMPRALPGGGVAVGDIFVVRFDGTFE